MNLGSKTLLTCLLLGGCAASPVKVLPPEIVKVPVFMPLPADCGDLPVVALPDGSSAADVMEQLRQALDIAEDQIQRCFDTSNPNGT